MNFRRTARRQGKGWLVLVALVAACGGSGANDFFGEPSAAAGGGSGSGAGGSDQAGQSGNGQGGNGQGGNGQGGAESSAGSEAGGGSADAGSAGQTGASGATNGGGQGGAVACEVADERCDGVDNDCDDVVDGGGVCPADCVGVAKDGRGYMICEPSVANSGSWLEARDACQDEGLDLAILESESENEWLLVEALKLGINDTLWIGASDLAEDDEWFWIDNTQFYDDDTGQAVDSRFINWGMSQPNDTGGNEACAGMTAIETGPDGGKWRDLACDASLAFICEVSE